MSEFRSGQFVKFLLPEKKSVKVGLIVGQDEFVPKRISSPRLVTPHGANLPLDALTKSGGEVVEILPTYHPDACMLLTRFLAPEGFMYGREPVHKTFLNEGCLIVYMSRNTKVKVLPVSPDVPQRVRNRVHALHAFQRFVKLPSSFRKDRSSGYSKGDLINHVRLGPGVHLGSTIIFERPFRLMPDADNDRRFADWLDASKTDRPDDLLPLQRSNVEFDRDAGRYPDPTDGLGPNSFELPHDWVRRKSHCPHCGDVSLNFTNMTGLGIMRHCHECSWTGLISQVRTTLKTILAAEQDLRLSLLTS